MTKENDLDIKDEDLQESDFTSEELESSDVDWKAKAQELKGIAKRRATQLKKAKDALAARAETKPEAKPPVKAKEEKSDDKLLERLENLALKVNNITADDEKELYSKWKESTGREADEILGNNIFQAELEGLRTAKANQEATSHIRGETGESGVKNTPEYWIAKATKGADGKLLFSDEMPKELYSKVLDKLAKGETGSSEDLKFYTD